MAGSAVRVACLVLRLSLSLRKRVLSLASSPVGQQVEGSGARSSPRRGSQGRGASLPNPEEPGRWLRELSCCSAPWFVVCRGAGARRCRCCQSCHSVTGYRGCRKAELFGLRVNVGEKDDLVVFVDFSVPVWYVLVTLCSDALRLQKQPLGASHRGDARWVFFLRLGRRSFPSGDDGGRSAVGPQEGPGRTCPSAVKSPHMPLLDPSWHCR